MTDRDIHLQNDQLRHCTIIRKQTISVVSFYWKCCVLLLTNLHVLLYLGMDCSRTWFREKAHRPVPSVLRGRDLPSPCPECPKRQWPEIKHTVKSTSPHCVYNTKLEQLQQTHPYHKISKNLTFLECKSPENTYWNKKLNLFTEI